MALRITVLFMLICNLVYGQANNVQVTKDKLGFKLEVDGRGFIVNGMNWDYFPIGTNYQYSLWQESDEFIQKALDYEMGLLKGMGVNTIRVYSGMPKKWIEYIYQQYGIYTMLNHSFGRYGLTLNGKWVVNTEYSSPATKELLLKEVTDLVNEYKDTKGLLLYLLGNENNYGLFWDGAETENIPMEDRRSTKRAASMYQLFDEACVAMKKLDKGHPVAVCNGDLLFLDLIKTHCPNMDILGTNMYRGVSFTDAFENTKSTIDKPLLFTEFGADAFNVAKNEEDGEMQAKYLKGNWSEIYSHAYGMNGAGISLGGFTFQFSDGWWKFKQTTNLDFHDPDASWSNGGYKEDFSKGENNMNEEWFGICAKGTTREDGTYPLFPRAGYYLLREIHKFNPLTAQSKESLNSHFSSISIDDAADRSAAKNAGESKKNSSKIKLHRLSAEFTTFNTGGDLISTPSVATPNSTTYPNQLGFDHMESFYIGIEANPTSNINAKVEFNILGNVPRNPIDQIFFENRGRPVLVNTPNGTAQLESINRFQVYRASASWKHKWFELRGFYRTGHYHWGYEGDFFALYQEANYGPNIDIYNGIAPLGFEIDGKKALKDFKIAVGPQLWWGANPAMLIKYRKEIPKLFDVAIVYHEDLQQLSNTQSSFAIPQPQTRRATLHLHKKIGSVALDLGGIWAGQPLNGRTFQVAREDGVYQSQINWKDNFGGKAKIAYSGGNFNIYAQTALMGLVANGGADNTQTFTGWRLKDSGSGNQYNVLGGLTYSVGKFQFAPNFLMQKPLEGPVTSALGGPARPRNIISDPFVVRGNREMMAGEFLITFDPTPGTWMYEWDNDKSEDAKLAISAGFVYRHLPTTQDAAIGIFPDGRTTFAFPAGAPAQDLWEVNTRVVSKLNKQTGIIANIYGGNAQANGSDIRTISRFGIDLRAIHKKLKLTSFFKVNDWGPYDYHRDFNLTFPLQAMADLSLELGKPNWFIQPETRIGVRGTWRSLDQYSPRYCPTHIVDARGNSVCDPTATGFPNGNEWEIRFYVHFNINN